MPVNKVGSSCLPPPVEAAAAAPAIAAERGELPRPTWPWLAEPNTELERWVEIMSQNGPLLCRRCRSSPVLLERAWCEGRAEHPTQLLRIV